MDFSHLSGSAIARLIKDRDASPTEVMSQALLRAQEVQKRLNPLVTIAHEHAMAQAQQAETALKNSAQDTLPPFLGVPFTVKDLLDTSGVRTTYGSKALEHNIPTQTVVAVARLIAAGAILIGKTTTSEFASKVTTDSPLTGATLNPWAPTLSAGGSSGGAGVCAAAGVAPWNISTDGGGSSRIPAAVCGVLGLKVTIGAIPHESWPFHFGNNSSISLNCQHTEDLVELFNLMSGSHHLDPWSRRNPAPLSVPTHSEQAVTGKRGLYIPTIAGTECDASYKAVVDNALKKLETLGLNIDVATGDPTEFNPGIATQMMICNLAARVRQLPAESQNVLGPVLQSLLDDDKFKSDGVQVQADAISRSQLYDRLEKLLSSYDFILSPTLTAPPPLADPAKDQSVLVNGVGTAIEKWWTHLSVVNLTGHPAISIPCGTDNALPVGLHAIAGWDREQDLVSLASAVSTFHNWSEHHPPDVPVAGASN